MIRKGLGSTLAILVLIAGTLSWTSCGSSSNKVRFAHALATGIGAIDILIDNRVVVTNLAYGAGGNYVGVSTGSHTVEVRPTGNTSAGSDVYNNPLTFQSGSQTAVLDFSGGPNIDLYTDQTTAPTSGTAILRVIHVSNYLGLADIYAVPPGSAITNVSPQQANLQFQKAASINLSSGNYEVFVTQGGTKFVQIQTGTSLPALNSQQIKTMILYDNSPFYFVLNDLN